MKTILDTLEAARLAASPSQALDLADALADLHALADALDRTGLDLSETASALDVLKALREHVKVQPFETDDDEPLVTELTPGAFADWLATLERLAG
jgi:hypothetical protein